MNSLMTQPKMLLLITPTIIAVILDKSDSSLSVNLNFADGMTINVGTFVVNVI